MNMTTINGRTPEEIKKGLECCSVDGLSCSNCSYCVSCDADIHALERDALALIQQLENHIGELTEMVQQLERERDAAVEAQPKWISVEERLPEPFVPVIVYMPKEAPCPPVHEGYRTKDGRWYSAYFVRDLDEVTHWRPLPEPPKEET